MVVRWNRIQKGVHRGEAGGRLLKQSAGFFHTFWVAGAEERHRWGGEGNRECGDRSGGGEAEGIWKPKDALHIGRELA